MKFSLTVEDANGSSSAFTMPTTMDAVVAIMTTLILTGGQSFVIKQHLEGEK